MLAKVVLLVTAASALIDTGPLIPEARTFTIPLTAGAEPADLQALGLAGDADGFGMVKLTVDPENLRICYDFAVDGLATPLMAHIHKGSSRDNGPSVVTLFTGPGDLRDCVPWTEKWIDAIVADPSGFYVNLSTTEFPEGALRGQLPA